MATYCFITFMALLCCILSDKPHIVYVLIDDLGWANVEFHNYRMKTPHLNDLLQESLYLNHFYTYKFCSPTRSSLMSGRIPYHVNEKNGPICAPGFGVPLNMTMISERLVQDAGYVAAQIGKWHMGFASMAHIPFGRNFSNSLGYIASGIEDHYTQGLLCGVNNQSVDGTDLWATNKPAFGKNGTYGGYIYGKHAVNVINNHDQNKPLFMYLATQNNHCPYQVPQSFIDQFNSSWYELQRQVAGMSLFEDELIHNVTQALKHTGMWNNTLLIITADNGGPSGNGVDARAANNCPFRGGKYSDFEGGIRVVGLISGGYLPGYKKGKSINGTIHIADFYSTLCHIVGLNPEDKRAEAAGLPPIDSINMWPYLISNDTSNTSPRTQFVTSSGKTGGLIQGNYKLLFGNQNPAFWTTLDYPNGTEGEPSSINCGSVEHGGCLFNIIEDETEHNDIVNKSENAQIVAQMRETFIKLRNTTFSPDIGTADPNCCVQIEKNAGYWGPWL